MCSRKTAPPIADAERRAEIEQALWGSLQRPEEAPLAVSRRATRQMRVFKTPTQIAISIDERNRRSVLELTRGDRPGLLCDVGKVLWEERVDLHAAKISTLGERAEDVFYLTDRSLQPLDEAAAERLRARLTERSTNAWHESQSGAAARVPVRAAARIARRCHTARAPARHLAVDRRAAASAPGLRARGAG